MKWHPGSIIVSGFMIAIPVIGLILSFLIISPMQASQMSLKTSVDVAATAQAIQSHRRQVELEARIQTQQVTWESQVARKQQTLAEANRDAQAQLAPLQAQFLDLQAQLNQAKLDVETARRKELELQQAIQADEADYQLEVANLKHETEQIELELVAASTQLQASYDELAKGQVINPTLSAGESARSPDGQGSRNDDHHSDPREDDRKREDKDDDHKED